MHRRLFLTQTISIQHVCESESVIVHVCMVYAHINWAKQSVLRWK